MRTMADYCPPTSGSESGSASNESATADYANVPGLPVLPGDGISAFQLQGKTERVEVSTVAVEGQPFSRAIRARILEGSGSEWSVQLQASTSQPIAKGDVMLATFYVRAEALQETGYAESEFVFERAGEPYTKSVTHSFGVTTEWRKVQVRFVSAEDYPAGGAQAIFRLGYDPESLEFADVKVESFGKKVPLAALPTTQGIDRKYAPKVAEAPLLEPVAAGDLRFDIQPTKVVGRISPYVYGLNSQQFDGVGATVRRMGGNRQTAYNWELNASSAGSDWQHLNDRWPCEVLGYKNCDEPGGQMTTFVKENRQAGMDSLVTIPMIDFVSADFRGPVKEEDTAPSARYLRSYPKKPGPNSLVPDLADGKVYQSELVNLLVQKLGRADHRGTRFYSLDNEPALWPTTHPRVHPKTTTYEEVIQRTEATASMITEIDPSATVLGGVMFGWSEFMSLNSAPDSEKYNARYGTYVDYFLAEAKQLEAKYHRRLVHVLDVHWYPEPRGAKRITERDASRRTIDVRLEAPRSLWDSNYKERSWITDQWEKPIRLIPWLLEKIDQRYPGTKLSLTEYSWGAGDHISGGLAQADVLGIFGRYGLYLANYWGDGPGNGKLPSQIVNAFKLYRNFDKKGGKFGDTAVEATVADITKASVYAAVDSKRPGTLTIVVINKDQRGIYHGRFKIGGKARYTRVSAYGFDARTKDLRLVSGASIKGNELSYELQPLSATILVCAS